MAKGSVSVFSTFLILALVNSPMLFASPDDAHQRCGYLFSFAPLDTKSFPEIRDRVGRSFLSDANPVQVQSNSGHSGFWVKTDPEDLKFVKHPIKSVTQSIPRKISQRLFDSKHDLNILSGINKWIGDYTEKRGPRKQLGWTGVLLGSLILSVATSPATIWLVENGMQESAVLYSDARIVAQWSSWGDAVRYDYRNYGAKIKLSKGEISALTAREHAYRNNFYYKDFFVFLKDPNQPKNFASQKSNFEKSELFSHVQKLKLFVLGDRAAFFALHPGPMTDEQESRIFSLDQELYINYEAVSLWVDAGAPRNLSRFGAKFRRRLETFLNDEVAQKLIGFRDEGRLTNQELRFFMQRDLSDRHNFAIRELLGLIPYKFENGAFTDQLDTSTLREVQNSTIEDILKHQDFP